MGQFSVEKPVAPGSVLSGNQQPRTSMRTNKLEFKGKAKAFVSSYAFLSSILPYRTRSGRR